MRTLVLLCTLACALGPSGGAAASPWTETRTCGEGSVLRARGAYGTVSLTSIADPLVRHVNGTEVSVPQSASTYGLGAGAEIVCGSWGGAIGLSYWGGFDLAGFRAPQMPGQSQSMLFDDGRWQTIMVDLQALYFPWEEGPVGLGIVLGLGAGTYSYRASGSSFPDWNREVSDTEFRSSFGLVVRWFIIPHVSLRLEGRLVPGDSSTQLIPAHDVDCPAGYDCFYSGSTDTLNYVRMLSVGLSVSM